jgi:hypothetical protein
MALFPVKALAQFQSPTAGGGGGGGGAPGSYSTSLFYTLKGITASTGAGGVNANRINCQKGVIDQTLTLSVLNVYIPVTVGTSNFQIAVYADAAGLPGALLSSTPSAVDTALGVLPATLSANVQVTPGSYWFCTNFGDSTALPAVVAIIPGVHSGYMGANTGTTLFSLTSSIAGFQCVGAGCNGGSSTFGTWPSTLAGSTWADMVLRTNPLVTFKPFSIP